MDYQNMFAYVKKILEEHDAIYSKKFCFRNRYTHIERVFQWCQRIMADAPECNQDVLLTAAIFHDVGYAYGQTNHAENSVKIFKEYVVLNHLDSEFSMHTARLIEMHSNKELLKDESTEIEMILLLEADLLDEEGALGIVWDLMAEGANHPKSYQDAFHSIECHTVHILSQKYMVTPLAKKYWIEKQRIVQDFIDSLKSDLFMNE